MINLLDKYTPEELIVDWYKELYDKYGAKPESLGWSTESQHTRFKIMSNYVESSSSVLDIGCGFGDFVRYLPRKFKYLGIDVMPDFIEAAKIKHCHPDVPETHFKLMTLEEIQHMESLHFGCVVASGLFILDMGPGTWEYYTKLIKHFYSLCTKRLILNFMSSVYYDRVSPSGYGLTRRKGIFYISPAKALDVAFGLSDHVLFDQTYQLNDFTLVIDKQQFNDELTSAAAEDAI